MNKFQLFKLLSSHNRLSNRRSLMSATNRAGKVFTLIGVGIACIYLIALGTVFGLAAVENGEHAIFAIMPFALIIDFLIRLGIQQTPTMLIKPYLLTPIKRKDVIECFLLSTQISLGNLMWLSMFIPYSIISICGGNGVLAAIAELITCQIIISINSLLYQLARTLATSSILWWALPVCLYAAIVGLAFAIEFEHFMDICCDYGLTPLSVCAYVLLLVAMFFAARAAIQKSAYNETAKTESVKMKKVSQFSFLNRYGLIGEYIKLEIKSTMRNKVVRQRFIQSVIVITLLSVLLAYTDVYDDPYLQNMWCLYCFVLIGTSNLGWIMGPEGNFIDLLMVHDENIYTLLKAKYYFYCTVLLLPLIILTPTVISGRFSVLMLLAYLFMTSGVCYMLLFQLAVYNKRTMPLNKMISGSGSIGNSLQIVVSLVVLFMPVLLAKLIILIFSETQGYGILAAVGFLFTVTNSLWLRNIYKRVMRQRYKNLEGFHDSRDRH